VLQEKGIDTRCLISDSSRPTTAKTRIMAQMGLRFPQQVARLDTLSREAVSAAVEREAKALIEREIGQANAVLVSDYHGGFLTPALVECVRAIGRAAGVLLTADAQDSLEKYTEFGLVKCNADDAGNYLGRELHTDTEFAQAAQELCHRLKLTGGMVITRGPDGATVATADGQVTDCPAPAVTDVYDTVGAGDTAIAVLTLTAAAGATYPDATTLANYASGLVVRRVGNYAPSADELLWALETWG
jgi:rfaE bifunctional protein kinase chain/domain